MIKKIIYVFFLVSFFSCSTSNSVQLTHIIISDSIRIKSDLTYITKTDNFRNCYNPETLDKIAAYIKTQFSNISDSVSEQKIFVNDTSYKNIICSLGTQNNERIIIGAHYDVCGDQEGADDNASGIAGLMELARLMSKENLKYRLDFVAYSLEEPPYFRTKNMGSYRHAKYLHDCNVPVKGMICLEMIGFYSDKPHSQHYPLDFLELFYGDKADFIGIVQKCYNGEFGNNFRDIMQNNQVIPTKSFTMPSFLPGVDYSDHLNYWKFGYSSVMITNTAFFRNRNYHKKSDVLETLDIHRIALVVDELYLSLKEVNK